MSTETFDLFPGFKVPPTDPSRDVKPRAGLTVAPHSDDFDDGYEDEMDDEPCPNCDGAGFTDCYCGGDFCICRYNGEKPCWTCV